MSNLVKPYEISVWDDVWEGKFIEKKLLVIGTDEMTSLNRALEPVLTRNVNGTKKFSFKMYKRYIDRETGEEVHNLFIDYLINERKIKLKYGVDDEGNPKWYDFIIKNVNETSTNYLYQFDLEDAIVQELSKNGFGMTLDAQLNNNMGTADELAIRALADTGWTVSGSDKLVQEVKEHLVYVNMPDSLNGHKMYQLKTKIEDDPEYDYDRDGVQEVEVTNFVKSSFSTVLAFYSSCTGKPHRFQFIALTEDDKIEQNEDNIITTENCQYFIEYGPDDYTVPNNNYNLILPTGWSVRDQGDSETGDKDTTVSYKYRGNRFGYAQQAVYLPKLDRYVNKYTNSAYINADGTDKIIYGYVDNEYVSPVLMTNLISNTEFKNTSGWKGVGYGTPKQGVSKPESTDKPTVENVYGTKENSFESALDRLSSGTLGDDPSIYEAYMKLTFPKKQDNIDRGYIPAVINSGPFDNRTLIGKITEGDQWALYIEGRTPGDLAHLNFSLEESEYTSGTGCYVPFTTKKIDFSSEGDAGPQSAKIFTFTKCDYNEKTFKKQMKLRLVITRDEIISNKSEHYIKTIELHKVVRDKDDKIIRLNAQADKIDEGVVNTKYFYFTEEAYDAAATKDEIEYIHTADKAEPSEYKPVYNSNAEKIRSVTAKESNYFNILQSIAETFEAWLDLYIDRDTETGFINSKTVSFKKYSGGNNYAAFRYGVNLKDITRTTESKQIVTKLIVKNNSNELAPNKFCTIQRAPSNVSGENYIYDFQYYHNNGLLDADDYLNELYYTKDAKGKDIDVTHTDTNIKGYFPRLKVLNNKLVDINDKMLGLSQELLQLKAEREVAEATYEAAESGIEQASEDFETLTGFGITAYSVKQITSSNALTRISDWSPEGSEEINESSGSYLVSEDLIDGTKYPSVSLVLNSDAFAYTLNLSRVESEQALKTINATLYTPIKVGSTVESGIWMYQATPVKFKFESKTNDATGYTFAKVEGTFNAVDTERSDVNKLLTEYLTYQQEKTKSENEKTRLAALIDGNDGKQKQYDTLNQQFEDIRDNQKLPLNKAFFQKYSRFIQEGTWIDEQYVDDEKYYNDAQTVLYNSCYPKVGYTINVLSLSKMPGYEFFVFDVGEKTYAEDEEFFGTDANGYPNRTEIIITEMSEHLDNPSADSIKVQNFKNQFQDLFQKITATVQQTQYNEGTYRKGAALIEASNEKKNEFLLDSLSDPASVLSNAGQNEVVWDNAGITVTNKNNRSEQLRLVSSGIMFSTDSEGGPKWSTGITPQGISANKILAGSINTGEISLMNGKDTSFLWNAFGINAFDYEIENGTVTSVNKSKFVRFDKNGIYGINGMANADAWKPNSPSEVDEKATFALTWEGLKVTGNNNVVARIGKSTDSIINITNNGSPIFQIKNDGSAKFAGDVMIGASTAQDLIQQASAAANEAQNTANSAQNTANSAQNTANSANELAQKAIPNNVKGNYSWSFDSDDGLFMWNKQEGKDNLVFKLTDGTLWMKGNGYFTGDISGANGTFHGNIELETENVSIKMGDYANDIINITKNSQPIFKISNEGALDIQGRIIATSGTIAGWEIVENEYHGTSGPFSNIHKHEKQEDGSILGTGIQPPTSGNWSFAAGYTDYNQWSTAPFRVSHKGELYASSGEIGGFIITDDSLYSWDGTNNNTVAGIGKYGGPQAFWAGSRASDSAPFRVSHKGILTAVGAKIESSYISDCTVANLSVSSSITNNVNYAMYLNDCLTINKMSVPTFPSDRLNLDGQFRCGFVHSFDPNTNNDGYFTLRTGKTFKNYHPVLGETNEVYTFAGIRFTLTSWQENFAGKIFTYYKYTGGFEGEWDFSSSTSPTSTDSDRRLKNTISPLATLNKYEILFDGLVPAIYKYNNGTSDRTHVGFIAQEVKSAMDFAGISNSEFAGLTIENYDKEEEQQIWRLRYEEFIALNTSQIQKLKPRVSTLEQTILNYESRISNLEAEIQNLKSTQNSDII